jgi:ABC-type Fe3+ transport system permease subunit
VHVCRVARTQAAFCQGRKSSLSGRVWRRQGRVSLLGFLFVCLFLFCFVLFLFGFGVLSILFGKPSSASLNSIPSSVFD